MLEVTQQRDFPKDLLLINELVYTGCDFKCSAIELQPESVEYGGCSFKLNYFRIIFRVAKITPTKVGHFVTVWKRLGMAPIQPYDATDPLDFIIISTRKNNYFGQFIFPKSILVEKDIISFCKKGGKRGIRVYPPWDRVDSSQARKTQEWQIKYFLDMTHTIDYERAKKLLSLIHL